MPSGTSQRVFRAEVMILATWFALGGRPGRAIAEGPVEIVRVRVPAARASAYFPPEAAVRTLAGDQFAALVAAAERAAADDGANRHTFRQPVRIDHVAHQEGAVLVGRSLVTLPATPEGEPVLVACEPWSPALLASAEREAFARVDATGRLVLVQPGNQPARVVELAWKQAVLPEAAGRSFGLRLPAADVAVLAVDLPAGIIPITHATRAGSRLGPKPTRSDGLVRWEFACAAGSFPLHLQPRDGNEHETRKLALGGPIRIDLTAPAINWVATWQVEASDRRTTSVRVELDPGVELIEAVGPDLEGFRVGTPDAGGRVVVELLLREVESSAVRATSITLRGRVEAPLEGVWPIPRARPVDADWLGGRVEVQLDPGRVVTAVVEQSGRRVVPLAIGPVGPASLAFETDQRRGPVADLTFGRIEGMATVEIRGALRIGAQAPRIEVAATWTPGRGPLFDPTLDLPANWLVDRVQDRAGRAITGWHVEAIVGAARRLHLDGSTASLTMPDRSIAVVMLATRVEDQPVSPIEALALPRVRPMVGAVRVADERWSVAVEPGWEVEPTASQGLAWLDPTGPTARPDESGLIPDRTVAPAGQRLAWRWVGDTSGATIVRRRLEIRPRVDERLEATIVAGRLRLVWYWTIAEIERPDALACRLDLEPQAAPRWRLVEASGGGVVEPRELDQARWAALGFPSTGTAFELPLGHLRPGPITLRGETEVAWSGTGPVPLISFPASVATRRSVVVRVEDATRFRVDHANGLAPVGLGDPLGSGKSAAASPTRAIIGLGEPGLRIAGAWIADGPAPARLDVATLDGSEGSDRGVVTEAALTSRVSPGMVARHRLILRIAAGSSRTVDLQLPGGATLDRIRRDGQMATATFAGPSLRVDLPPSDPTRPTSTITLDYRTPADRTSPEQMRPARFLPGTSLPCLSFTWQVNAPERFSLRSDSPDLVATDLANRAVVGTEVRQDGGTATPEEPDRAAMFHDLDLNLTHAPPRETTLGDWLIRLDAGRWPLVLDRLALQSIGWGPKSRLDIPEADPSRPPSAEAAFHALGLTIEPIGGTFLVSVAANPLDVPSLGGRSPRYPTEPGRILLDAAVAGADPADRYQTPARWRGEPTPRAWLASETPDRGQVVAGWQSHRFTAATWPAAGTTVRITAARNFWRVAGLIAAGLAAVGTVLGTARAATWRQAGRRVGIGLAGCLALTCSAAARFDRDPAGPIIALFPYEDLAAIEAPPTRVMLRQEDHDRLVRLAQSARLDPEPRTLLVAASHHIAVPIDGASLVTSRYDVEVTGSGPGAGWSFPVGSGRNLTATVAGQPVPLAISPDGRTASIGSLPAGRSAIEFRRSVPVRSDPGTASGGGSIRVEVIPAAFAQIRVDPEEGHGPIARLDPTGLPERPDGVTRALGPRGEILVHWGQSTPEQARPEVAATIRWDALPAGDRLTARLTVVGETPLRSFQIELEPGLAVIGHSIPGLVGATTGLDGDRPRWGVAIDPPLDPGRVGEVTFWRPSLASSRSRTIPRWEPVGVRMTGFVGFRRPADWSGRLAPVPSPVNDPLGDLLFARLWGAMPADGLIQAGTARWDAPQPVAVRVGPGPTVRSVRDQVGVEVVPGQLRFIAESVLADRLGVSWEADATFADPVRLVRVEGAGLSSWTQPRPDQVHLTFDDAVPTVERSIRLQGIVETSSAPVGDRGESLAAVVPWPAWTGAVAEPGTLVVTGAEGLEVRAGDQVVAANPVEPAASGAADLASGRQVWTIRPGWGPLRLGWTSPAPRVGVTVDSDLRLEPRRATWTARVTCSVVGGSARTLSWKLPTVWADGATLTTLDGKSLRVQAETRNNATFWTITCDEPFWDRRTFLLRSVRAVRAGSVLDYPEVSPLSAPGRGSVEGYDVAITNLAGDLLRLDSSTGVIPRPGYQSEASALPGGAVSQAFRVTGEAWSLRLRAGSTERMGVLGPSTRIGQFDDRTRPAWVEHADLRITLDSEFRAQGQADCRVEPSASFLAVMMAEGTRLIGATVDGRPTPPIEPRGDDPGRWLIPLGDGAARRVVFDWVGPPTAAKPAELAIWLPRFDQPAVPTSITTLTTGWAGELAVFGGTWTRLTRLEAALARCERLGSAVAAGVRFGDMDPASPGSGAVLRPLIELALELRTVRRALRAVDAGLRPQGDAWLAIEQRAHAAVVAAGGEALIDLAREQVGLTPPKVEPGRAAVDQAFDVYRIRQIGRADHFQGTTDRNPGQSSALVDRPRAP